MIPVNLVTNVPIPQNVKLPFELPALPDGALGRAAVVYGAGVADVPLLPALQALAGGAPAGVRPVPTLPHHSTYRQNISDNALLIFIIRAYVHIDINL